MQGWQTFGSGLWGIKNSSLFDPWSLAHVIGGGLQAECIPLGFCINLLLHIAFEVIENMFPEAWPSRVYEGDTVLNSIGDVIAFAVGWVIWSNYVSTARVYNR
jgi:hypothetical protein